MDVQKELGQKIREIRIERKFSLKELSEKTGLSIGFLSMVERGLTSVAIVSLKKIADALGYDISELFQGSAHKKENGKIQKHIINRNYDQHVMYHHGKYIYFSLSDNKSNHIIDPMIILLLPGQSRKEVIKFRHAGEEFAYVLEGILSLFLGDQEYELYPGDSFFGTCDTPHNFVNLTNNLVRVLFVLTPPLFSSDQNLLEKHDDTLYLQKSFETKEEDHQ